MPLPLRSFLLIMLLATGLSASAGFRALDFTFNGVSNRFITPNGDGLNDFVMFSFSNPSDSAGTIKIYDLRGHLLTTISINSGGSLVCPTGTAGDPGCPVWDGKVNGSAVATGVYIYVLSVDSVHASGALVVIK